LKDSASRQREFVRASRSAFQARVSALVVRERHARLEQRFRKKSERRKRRVPSREPSLGIEQRESDRQLVKASE
jgi:hypothetical protein